MPLDAEELGKRIDRAKAARDPWGPILKDAFRLAAPDLDTKLQGIGTPGQNRRSGVYDSTAIQAVEDASAATHAMVSPPYEPFFQLDLSPPAAAEIRQERGEDELREWRLTLDVATEVFRAHLAASNFDSVIGPVYAQELISTGPLLFNEAPPGADSAFEFEALPLADIYPEQSSGQVCRTVFRAVTKKAEAIAYTWPAVDWPAELRQLAKDKPGEDVEFVDGAVYDWASGKYTYVVYWPQKKRVLLEQQQDTSPLILFRSQVAPGEMLGRGRVLNVLDDIKTLNKCVELVLKNASIAVTGIWQADDDGVINPATIRLQPGMIIPKAVGSNGLQPLKAPGNFDVSELLIGELRQRIRIAIVGPELPAMEGRRDVTATEIDRRWSEVQLLRAPRNLRLWEGIVAMVRRGFDILARRGELPEFPALAVGAKIRVMPTSRMLQMAQLADVLRAQSALGTALQAFPEDTLRVIDREASAEWMLRRGGYPEQLFTTPEQRDASRAAEADAAAAAQEAELANKAAPMVRALAAAEEQPTDAAIA